MATRSNKLVPSRAIHPGEILKEELRERGIKQKEFAEDLGMQKTHLSEFINGKRNLNEELAVKLEKLLGIPFSVWMNLHNSYVYDCIAISERTEAEQEAMNYEETCNKYFNLKLLYKKLGLSKSSIIDRVSMLKKKFPFDLRYAMGAELQVAGMYKHSEKVQIDEKNMNTWLLFNWIAISEAMAVNKYSHGNALIAAEHISRMANAQEISVEKIKSCLNYFGIVYVEVEKLEKAPVDAFSTLFHGTPVITVTYRYDDLDKLVFDVLHELCHIDRHISADQNAFISVEGAEYSKDPREKEANAFARDMLISEDDWHNITKVGCKSLSPHTIVRTIGEEAKKRGISPTIAVSRFKHDANWYRTPVFKSPKISEHYN